MVRGRMEMRAKGLPGINMSVFIDGNRQRLQVSIGADFVQELTEIKIVAPTDLLN